MNSDSLELPAACVLDASVLLRDVLPGSGSTAARRLRRAVSAGTTLAAVPDLVYAECANAFWKYIRVGRLDVQDAEDALHDLESLPFEVHSIRLLAHAALALATRFDVSVYDAVYVALAARLGSPMITLDQRLVRKLAPSTSGVRLLTDFEPAS